MKDNINGYKELKDRQQEELNNFPIYWAFGDKQYKELLEKLHLTEEEANDKLVAGPGGGAILKEDVPKFKEMMDRHHREIVEKIEADKTGKGFIKDMFLYELNNHEYSYTRDLDDTLIALGLTDDDFNKNEVLGNGLRFAISEINEYEKITNYGEESVLPKIEEMLDNGLLKENEYNFLTKKENWLEIAKNTINNADIFSENENEVLKVNIRDALQKAKDDGLIEEAIDEDEEGR